MTYTAIFAALIAVCSWLCIPLGDTVFTMQTFAVFLTLGLLGGRWGGIAIGVYLLLGAVGLPVFSGFRGGMGMLLGVTGGYLWGFLLSAAVYRLTERFGILPAMVMGQIVCYLCGCAWFALYSGGGFGFIFLRCVAPFLLPDAAKLFLAHTLTHRLRRHIHIT